MLYQLGACACGCIDHNYWLQAVGIASDHHHHAGKPAADQQNESGDRFAAVDHDCDGGTKPLYLNNAPRTKSIASSVGQFDMLADWVLRDQLKLSGCRAQDRGPPILDCRSSLRSTLQVCLI